MHSPSEEHKKRHYLEHWTPIAGLALWAVILVVLGLAIHGWR